MYFGFAKRFLFLCYIKIAESNIIINIINKLWFENDCVLEFISQ